MMGVVFGDNEQIRCDRCGLLCNCLYKIDSEYSKNTVKLCDECLLYATMKIIEYMGSARLDTIVAHGIESFRKNVKIHKKKRCVVCDCNSDILLQLKSDKVCMYCLIDGFVKTAIATTKYEKGNGLNWPF